MAVGCVVLFIQEKRHKNGKAENENIKRVAIIKVGCELLAPMG